MSAALNFSDFRLKAKRRLPKGLFEYIDRGTEDELALTTIRDRLDRLKFLPRILAGDPDPVLETTVFGRSQPQPLVVAPTALAGLVAHDGEVKLARVAAAHGLPFTVSTQSITGVEDIRAAVPDATLWFQLYMWQDRALSYHLLEQVKACGISTLVVTLDTPVSAKREYNTRNGFGIPFSFSPRAAIDMACHPGWLARVMLPYLRHSGVPTYGNYPPAFRSKITRPSIDRAVKLLSLSREDLVTLRARWQGEIILKGVLHPDDAELAVNLGADGIVVSAHGGRNLDAAVAPADVLPQIAQRVAGRLKVFADSGVRRGSDVLKYLALGADAVLLGRLPLWALAANGERGADQALHMLVHEMTTTMALIGARMPGECEIFPHTAAPARDAAQ